MFGSAAEKIILYVDQETAERNLEPYIKFPPTEQLRHIHIKNDPVCCYDIYGNGQIISDNFVIDEFRSLEEMKGAISVVRKKWDESRR